jgi:hypothetical protein
MNSDSNQVLSFTFPLIDEDGWPPVSAESLPFLVSEEGFRLQAPPLFIRDMSVGDVLNITFVPENVVESWNHVYRSARSTIWLGRLTESKEISGALEKLRSLGCNTVTVQTLGCYSIDVPEEILILDVDTVLDALDSNVVAVAFPSMRHLDQA